MTGGLLALVTVTSSVQLALWLLRDMVQAQVQFLVDGVTKLSGRTLMLMHMVEILISSTVIIPDLKL